MWRSWLRVFRSVDAMRLGYGGRHARQTGAMLSEKCAARRGRAWDGMRVSTICFTRALQRCAGRTNMRFLFILQEVRAIGKTRNQFGGISVQTHPMTPRMVKKL